MLSIGGDATSEYSVTWRTPEDDSGDRVSHEVRFTGLEPNTQYSYRAGNGKDWSEWFQFSTAKKVNDKFSFIYFGDVQNDIKSLGSRTLRQAYKDLGKDASFMLFAGDLVSRSTDEY
ncbi:MAG: fibronectin type III domain-containing protein [Fermentimonas sp.]|nr:fibronectin type III domain-containing protein [Fermentimonas sp.]